MKSLEATEKSLNDKALIYETIHNKALSLQQVTKPELFKKWFADSFSFYTSQLLDHLYINEALEIATGIINLLQKPSVVAQLQRYAKSRGYNIKLSFIDNTFKFVII